MYEGTHLHLTGRSKPIRLKRLLLGICLTLALLLTYGYWGLSYGLSHMDLSGLGQWVNALTERVAVAGFALRSQLPQGDARTGTFVSPNGKITAVAYSRGPKGGQLTLQELQFRATDGRLLATEDLLMQYPRSNYFLLSGGWSTSEEFVFTVKNCDYPELAPLKFEYSLKSKTVRLMQ